MAINDTVGLLSADNTVLDFQPAAGVGVMIAGVYLGGTNTLFDITDNTLVSTVTSGSATLITGVSNIDLKIFINNTNFLRLRAGGASQKIGFSGITVN